MSTIATDKLPGRKRNRPLKDYTGMRFGRLVAINLLERRLNGNFWRFQCDCGRVAVVNVKQAQQGSTSSCGCIAREVVVKRNSTHGLCRVHVREYRSWKDMRGRCNNPQDSDFADYGGRGIKFCARWDDFAAFYADMGERPAGMTLDRIDVNGDYEPGNCRWATHIEQANNKRSNHVITMNGETRTLAQWCALFEIEPSKVRYRLKQGWPMSDVFSRDDFRR